MSRKYTITLNEEQLMLVSSCIEDIHRFLCGDTTLRYATSVLDVKDRNVLQKRLERLPAQQVFMPLKRQMLPLPRSSNRRPSLVDGSRL